VGGWESGWGAGGRIDWSGNIIVALHNKVSQMLP
jgi:hypothetical protein